VRHARRRSIELLLWRSAYPVTKVNLEMTNNTEKESESDLPTGLSKPAQRALAGAGYERLEQLAKLSAADVKRLHGMGPKALEQLRRALAAKGLSFAAGTAEKDAGGRA